MDKIGLLTFQNTTNFGSMLQSYALYKTIQRLGGNCELINYSCPTIEERELPLKLQACRSPKRLLKWLLCYRFSHIKYEKFQDFFEDNFENKTVRCTKDELITLETEYDRFIVGSDIIWGLDITGNDYTYFLDFVTGKKKYAYAASFGHDRLPFPISEIKKMKELMTKFDGISVRETSGMEIVKELSGKEATLVSDPTFLLERKDWEAKISSSTVLKDRNYILVYFAYDEKYTFQLAKTLAKKTGCQIVYIHNSTLNYPGVKNIKTASVEDFLWLIRNAEYVISGSYHGVVFSIIFNKNFYYINKKYTSRIKSLMDIFGLQDRILSEENIETLSNINYGPVNSILNNFANQSKVVLGHFIYD